MGKGDNRISAAKAAEALNRAGGGGGAGGGFGGFSGAAPTTPGGFSFGAKYVGAVQAALPGVAGASGSPAGGSDVVRASAIIPTDLDGELAQQLQKLSKRDATTKLKALQALRLLFKEKPAADVQAALPSWAYLFGRLVLDGSRAVRAEACLVTAAAAAAVGRSIAPLLKSLLPPWWLAQFDGYSEAAAAARTAFATAFPAPAKQRDAVLFCRAEVLQLLSDNLASTPQSLGDAKKESIEELQDRQERVLAASCDALAALLGLAAPPGATAAPRAELAAAEQEVLRGVGAQLERPAFYKAVLQSRVAHVRRASYRLVAAAAEAAPEALLGASVATAAPAVLGVLGDKEPANHEAAWGMLLAYARALPACWRHVGMQKAFLPRLWAFLRHACYGSAAASYPAVLPLVSLLPEEVLGPRPAFFVSLLEATWQGLGVLAGGALGGRQARQAACAAYQDCLLYALLKADALADVGGDGADRAGGGGVAYADQLLQAVLGQALMPALTAASPEAAEAASEAEAVLTGAVARLGQPTASAASRQRLEQLLSGVGAGLAAALQEALARDGGGSEPFDRTAALVAALDTAAGPVGSAAVGATVAQPLVALLLPGVRDGSAPPAVSSLLAALLKVFPQHAAADVAAASTAAGRGGEASPGAAAAGASDEFASLRLHQSASYTIESVVRRLAEEQQPEATAASCDLLLCCLPQVHHPARKLADAALQLLQPPARHLAAAATLLEHLVSGRHADLAEAAGRSGELDRVAAALAAPDGPPLAAEPAAPRLLALLLAGDGSCSLLSPAAQVGVLRHLLATLQVAEAGMDDAPGETADADADAATAAAVLRVLQSALLAPALSASGGEVLGLRLALLAAAFRMLLQDAAFDAEVAAAVAAGGSDGASSFADESEAESVEQPQQPGAAAQQFWHQQGAVTSLLGSGDAQQRASFCSAAQQAVASVLSWHGSVAAALAVAAATAPLLSALSGVDALQHQLLQALLGRPQQPGDEPGSSSSAASPGLACSPSDAVFLAAVGAAAGFDTLLPAGDPGAAAQAAVDILAALAAAPDEAGELRQQLIDYVAGPAAPSLLQPALHAAAAAASQPGRPVVLAALLRAAVGGRSASLAAAARFFARATADASAQPLSPALLCDVLPIVGPAFRRSSLLLEQSALPALSQQLCRRSCAAQPVALADGGEQQAAALELLQAAVACFPCATGAEAAAQLPAPAAAAAAGTHGASGAAAAAHAKGDAVWYLQRDGTWVEAEVASVDLSVEPPSYGISLGTAGSYRETEAGRLQPRSPGTAPPGPSGAASAAAAAAERRAAGGSLLEAGHSMPEEQEALLALLQHQARGAKAAVAAARAEAAAAGARAAPQPASPAVASAVAALLHAAVAYAGPQLSQQQWSLLLEQLRSAFTQCSAALAAAAARVAAAVCAAASEIAVGADMSSPAVALQFFRRLQLKGVLERSAKAQAEATRVAERLAAELAALDAQLLPLLLPSLLAYTQAAGVAGASRALAEQDWQDAEAAACADMLQLFVAAGAVAAAASVCGAAASERLGAWMGVCGTAGLSAAAWHLLSQHVSSTLRAADRTFLLAAVDRANAGMDVTGVDALGSLLALSLSGVPPPAMASAAFSAILQHRELTASLTAAEGVDEDALEEEQRQQQGAAGGSGGGADAAALLEQVGVRPELAAAVASPQADGFLAGWALLLAHILAAPADSHGRRLLVQAAKDAHTLVPSLLDALVPLLPLDGPSSSGSGSRRDSAGSVPGVQRGGSRTASGSSSGGNASGSFPTQLLQHGPFPTGASNDADQQQQFAAQLYAASLQALPASARLWFADLRDRGTAAAVERYTAAAVSSQLLAAELAAVTEAAAGFGKFDKFSSRANAASREVVAVMEVEDGHLLELAVKLPASMPLRPPDLECRRKVGVSEGRLRKWLLSISAFLRTQNGSVAEAISLWKRNVEKEFEGQEECLICYSIIQPTSGQLPRLRCRTCAKHFHGQCLYRWFKSSGKSSCPHCVSPW